MKTEVGRYNLELYARYVKPQLDSLFEDEWEHRWWPQTCMQRLAPLAGDRPAAPDGSAAVLSAVGR